MDLKDTNGHQGEIKQYLLDLVVVWKQKAILTELHLWNKARQHESAEEQRLGEPLVLKQSCLLHEGKGQRRCECDHMNDCAVVILGGRLVQ